MAEYPIFGGGGGSAGSDDCTGAKSKALEGYTFITSDSADEPVEGTLPKSAVLAGYGGTIQDYVWS